MITPPKKTVVNVSNPFYSSSDFKGRKKQMPSGSTSSSGQPAVPKIIVTRREGDLQRNDHKCSSFLSQRNSNPGDANAATDSKKKQGRMMVISPSKKMLEASSSKKLFTINGESAQIKALKGIRPMFLSRSNSRDKSQPNTAHDTPTFSL